MHGQDESGQRLLQELERLRRRVALLEREKSVHRESFRMPRTEGLRVLRTTKPPARDFLDEAHRTMFQDLAERSGVGIYLLQNGVFHYVNPRFAEIHGYRASEMLYKLGPKETVFAEDLATVEENLRRRLVGEVRYLKSEFRIVTKSGDVRNVEVYSSRTTYGGKPAVIGTLLDITQRKRTEEEIEGLNKDLQRRMLEINAANEELKAFSSSVSHDLKAPLLAIEYASEKLDEKYQGRFDEKGRQYLKMITGGSRQMRELINDLLTFFSLGRKEMDVATLDMEEIVQDVFDQLKAVSPGREIDLRLGPLPKARGDKTMIRRVWVNLLLNAFKYTRPRETTVIEVGSRIDAGKDVYYVKDNGIGFSMEEADRIFQVFTKLHPPSEFEGTGLGLAIVKRAVQRHGGDVWAEGRPGEGATFSFSLPRTSS